MDNFFEGIYQYAHMDNTKEKEELLVLIEKHKATLSENLDDKNLVTLNKLIDSIEELQELYYREKFKNGFGFGIKMAVEILE